MAFISTKNLNPIHAVFVWGVELVVFGLFAGGCAAFCYQLYQISTLI